MTRILIVYATTFGNTQQMAEAARDGAKSTGAEVRCIPAEQATLKDGRWFDGLIMASPIRHRSADSRIKSFIERVLEVLWLDDVHAGKVGGVVTVGGGYGNAGAGVDVAQLGMLAAMAANGMLIVPLPKTTPGADVAGSHWGAHGRSGGPGMEPNGITDDMLKAGFHHGASIARVAKLVSAQKWHATGNVAPSEELRAMFAQAGSM